jgi:signal-transduction protein with cAMP-binding, CBS, and nucleotidyltransferase domain
MDSPLRQPEDILAFRSLQRMLVSRPRVLWSAGPEDSVLAALQLITEKNISFLVVLDRGTLVGVVSERDFVRKVMLRGKPPETTPVAEIMVREVVTVGLSHTFAECLKLMHQHSIRHLPVVDKGEVIAVVSIRDLLAEAITHHAKIIAELERERLTIFTSMA